MNQYKRYTIRKSQYFTEPCEYSWGNGKVGLDLSKYATKADLKEGAGVNVSKLPKISDLKVTSAMEQYFLKMCHLRHRLLIFLFHGKIMFHPQDIEFSVFLTIL